MTAASTYSVVAAKLVIYEWQKDSCHVHRGDVRMQCHIMVTICVVSFLQVSPRNQESSSMLKDFHT